MKKILLLAVVIFFICAVVLAPPAFAESERNIRVFVDKKLVEFDVKPFINEEYRTMVPIRFVSNELGASVDWDGDQRKVTIYQGDNVIELLIGDNFAHVNGEKQEFDTAAEIVEERTMVPLRFVNEALGAAVEWVGETSTIYITTKPLEPPPPPAVTTVTLYFSDRQAQYLVPEIREVALTGQPLAELVFKELKKGPNRPELRATVPENTRFNLIMFQDVAQLSLSSHFRDEHWGGTAGDQLTLYSIVNSLAELPEVSRVLFLLENKPQEAILGHTSTIDPLEPRPDLVKAND